MNCEVSGVYVFYLLGKPPSSPLPNQLALSYSSCDKNSESTANPVTSLSQSLVGSSSRCSCAKSRCVRLKCSCFNSKGYCGPHCDCNGCLNTPSHNELRNQAIEFNQRIFNNAFKTKHIVIVGGRKILASGCQCKRSLCETKYCACVKAGVGCSSICCCSECENHKSHAAITDKNFTPPQKNRRKRFRIIIKEQIDVSEEAPTEDLAVLQRI